MSFNVGLFPSPQFAALRESSEHHNSWVHCQCTALSRSSHPQPPSTDPLIIAYLEGQCSPHPLEAVREHVPGGGNVVANIIIFRFKMMNIRVTFGARMSYTRFWSAILYSILYWTKIFKTIQYSIPILYQVKSTYFKC
jgi:hypothetical protein